jgi:hypothetical protein
MSNSLINPFELLGLNVNEKIDLKEVKKTYHNFSLLTHPDKGGNATDFIIVHQAYKYVLEQVQQSKEMVEMEILEEDFKNFCLENKIKELPSLLDIRDETAVFNKEFNEQWEEQKVDGELINPFSMDNGYGNLMEQSEIIPEEAEQKDDKDIELTNKFTSDVMIYSEPKALPDNYGSHQRYDIDETDNFGNLPEQMYDYKETHTEYNPIHKIEDKIEDKPISNFEIKLLEKELERNSLVTTKNKIKLDFK